MFRIPELLAPAGGMEQLRAAVENGADAVYMGGKLFNARINAANFDDAEMKEAIAYAHMKGVRLYVTMNTLIKDSELQAALEYAASLYNSGADALIIQDLGFAQLVRENIPDFELHLSTQGTVYNLEGVKQAKKLGFSRVVLARELTLAEIKEIAESAGKTPEIEVFAHGALCISYSGQCQMSREIGGRSGNRGECAQPCRLPYSVYRADSDKLKTSGNDRKAQKVSSLLQEAAGSYFALSPKDLCTIEYLGQLSEAGVASLKIEGRMKTAEYVAVVTGIYRKYLDLYAEYGQYKVDPADLRDLNQIFNRGGFTEGYLFGNPKKNLMSGDLSKHRGIYIGKVTGSQASSGQKGNGCASDSLRSHAVRFANQASLGQKGNRQRGLITIQLDEKLSLGDGIEIRNRELSGNIVTFMKRGDKKADLAKKGDLVTVGYIDGSVSPGDPVYRITDKALMQRARASYEGKSGTAEKAMRKLGITFHFIAGLDGPVSLSAVDEEGNRVCRELPDRAEAALTRALTEDVVIAQLSKTGGTPFRVMECTAEIEEGISIPLSRINELRRTVLNELEALRRAEKRKPITIQWSLSDINRKSGRPEEITEGMEDDEEIFLYLYRASKEQMIDSSIKRIYVPYDAVLNGFYQNDERVVPVIPNITKGWHEYNIHKNFDKIVAASVKNGIAVGNMGWISPFAEAGVNVFGDYGLNLYNSMDFYLAGEMGIREAVVSHEADVEDILSMDFHDIEPEIAAGGKIPVMISEHCLFAPGSAWPGKTDSSERCELEAEGRCPAGDLNFCGAQEAKNSIFLKDRKGQFYPVLTDAASCRSVILSHKETNLLMRKEDLKKAGLKRFRIYTL